MGKCRLILWGILGSGLSDPGSKTGVPPGAPGSKKGAGVPVVGMKPPMAPKPGNPQAVPPRTFDPGDNVEQWSDQDESDTIVPVPQKKKNADP